MNTAMDAAMLVTQPHLDAPARIAKFAVSILDDAATIASAVTMGKVTTGRGGNGKNNNKSSSCNVVPLTDKTLPFQTKTTTAGKVVSDGIDLDKASV